MGADSERKARPRRSWWRRWLRRGTFAALAVVIVVFAVHQYVVSSVADAIHPLEDVPTREAILVLGASVLRDGRPSQILAERLRAAAELYHLGKAKKILVSGDHGQRYYDEVQPMARYLEDRGVPANDIFLDHAGFRTLDSVARARTVFGAEGVIVVSNPFHVPRAVFLAQEFGLDAVGVGADYGLQYSRRTRLRNHAREFGARLLAFCDVYFLGTKPRFGGPRIDLAGDGRVTRDRPR